MVNLNNFIAYQNLFEVVIEGVIEGLHFLQVKYITLFIIAECDKRNWLMLDNSFTLKADYRWIITHQELLADIVDLFLSFNNNMSAFLSRIGLFLRRLLALSRLFLFLFCLLFFLFFLLVFFR